MKIRYSQAFAVVEIIIFGIMVCMPYKYPRQSQYVLKVKRGNAGLGLFTDTSVKKNEFLIEYFGPILTNKQADNKKGKYLFEIDDKRTIDGSARENKARYINHSCKPNCEVVIEGKRVYVYSIKSIKAGEELTYDYGKDYVENLIKPSGCRCGNH